MDDYNIWKSATPKWQEENFEKFINIVQSLKDDNYYLFMLFSKTDNNVLKKHNHELIELLNQNKDNELIVENIWKVLDIEQQNNEIDLVKDVMNELLVQNRDISRIWKSTKGEVQQKMVDELLQKHKELGKSDDILRGLNIPLSPKNFQIFLEQSGVSTDNIDCIYELYLSIFKINNDINETIDFNMFSSEILDMFNLEKMARITTYPELQRKIIELNKVKGFDSVIKTINDENWLMELDEILKNVENYPELLKNMPNEEIDEKSAEMLVQVFSQKKNYFNISTIADANNYYEIRKEMCQRILNGDENEISRLILPDSSPEDRKRFAILEMMYGIDIDEARNIVEKYGKDAEKIIDSKEYSREALILTGIKRILECENISEKYEENREIINSQLENIEYKNLAQLEADCINMYSQMYKEVLYHPKKDDKIGEEEYNGQKIDVYEITEDFNMFVRADGACNGYEEPEDFSEKISNINTKYHGNCKSFIGQDSISIASSEGVKFGYSNCEKGTLLMCSPWDIVSNGANNNFSTASEKWDLNCGIQFRIPREMINNTRHTYNEFDFEQLVFDEKSQEFIGDKPQYVVYVQEPDVEREKDDNWRVTKKAAGQLQIPIVIIDREKCVQKEWEKVENLQNILLGKSENKDNVSDTYLMSQIITKFENNANSVRTSEKLSNEYFNSEQRNDMIKNIVGYIKSFEKVDFNKYQELFNTFKDIVENEVDKTISNTGKNVAEDRYGKEFLDAVKQRCSQIEEESKKRTLTDLYKEVGIEKRDLIESKRFLAKQVEEKRQTRNQDVPLEH